MLDDEDDGVGVVSNGRDAFDDDCFANDESDVEVVMESGS